MGEVIGAVLAGGRGARLGRPKPTAPLRGRALIEHPLAALREGGLEPVVVAKPDTPLPAIELTVWHEPAEPVHPLLGIVTALERADGRAVLACACDLPFVTPGLVSWIAGLDKRLAVPRTAGRLHPLLALYGPSLLGELRAALAREGSLHQTLGALDPEVLDEAQLRRHGDPERLLFNVNTPSDLARAEAMSVAGA